MGLSIPCCNDETETGHECFTKAEFVLSEFSTSVLRTYGIRQGELVAVPKDRHVPTDA